MKLRQILIAAAVLLAAACSAERSHTKETPKDKAPSLPVCSENSGLPCLEPTTGERLEGGKVVPEGKYPSTPWIGNCTAELVGERVLLSAAHCMKNGNTVSFSRGSTRYRAVCTHHPLYRSNATADFAACLVDKPVVGGDYEVVNTDGSKLAIGVQLTLTGYGCQKWGGPIDGKLREGKAPITALPKGNSYDLVTKGKVALCSGDSGGPAYLEEEDGNRVLVGVNSRRAVGAMESMMPAWHLAQSFLRDWADKANVRVCGLHDDAKGCRHGGGMPPQNTFELKSDILTVVAKLNPGKESYFVRAKALFSEAMAKVGIPGFEQ